MRIAICSDSHDHIGHLRLAVRKAKELGAEILIHCGDLISPFMLPELHRFDGPVHLIYGNNVGDQHLITSRCQTHYGGIHHHGILGRLTIAGKKIGFTHYPELARGLALTGEFDVVCCGHDHRHGVETLGSTLLINAGELLGKDEQPGLMLLDLADLSVVRHEVGRMLDLDIDD